MLLDLKLPRVSGLEVLRRLKEDDRTRKIPVIVLTGSREEADMVTCQRWGVEHYILKPVNFDHFSRVTTRMDMHWALFSPSSGAGTPSGGGGPVSPGAPRTRGAGP
jgi:two-component system, response regulator